MKIEYIPSEEDLSFVRLRRVTYLVTAWIALALFSSAYVVFHRPRVLRVVHKRTD